ncbi:capZ-interacting protein isoform X1 [Cynoglossus semilaevis]|uniref:Zgc:153184 n=1 Tax=Cynoglossus semilaevis TaxID=244447 RepID=A0A3P8VFQ1_CYNSE|nr:capZ-interacting protein-like isoform X1 [Cynoglossus semilaevis]
MSLFRKASDKLTKYKKDSPSKPSVAELAGRFKGHILPMPKMTNEMSFGKRPPCCLKIQNEKAHNEEPDKTAVSPSPTKIKMKNSAMIEKLQANLSLSPTSLLPVSKNPEAKLGEVTPTSPCVSPSPTLQLAPQTSEEEEPISFESPAEGTPLPSINKTRARLSFKRRLPTRQHRRSAGEDEGSSPCELNSPIENGDEEAVLKSPAEEEEEEKDGFSGRLDKGRDKVGFCKKTEDKLEKINPGCEGDPEKEPHAQQSQDSKAAEEEEEEEELRPSERCPSNQENVNNTRIAEGMEKEN